MGHLILSVFSWFIVASCGSADFLEEQKKYPRVREAIDQKQPVIEGYLLDKGLSVKDFSLILVAYKDSDTLEIFAKAAIDSTFAPLVSYPICARSGRLGPKRQQGDLQVPEGFYHIDRFNPRSNFHLSLGINYPNASDRKKSTASRLGGDIFIHGSCVTIGCLPMTDEAIKEIYLLAVHARNNGQEKIPVYIFPFRMSQTAIDKQTNAPELRTFWQNLLTGYQTFQTQKKALPVRINEQGDYLF